MRKKISILFFILCFSVFLLSGYFILTHFSEDAKQDNQYDMLVERVNDTEETTHSAVESVTSVLPEYAPLLEQNSELVGWLRIEDTQINYPVMQSQGDPDFYLKHLFDKTYSDYGCPYVEQKCDVNKPSDNLIIYGHHMRSDKMFSQLEKYKEKSFWENHRYVFFDTLYEKQTYEIIAAFKTVVYTDEPDMFKYYEFFDAENPSDFNEYVSRAKGMSTYETGVTAQYGDKLITLSTCEFSNKNGRFVVVAKRISQQKNVDNMRQKHLQLQVLFLQGNLIIKKGQSAV